MFGRVLIASAAAAMLLVTFHSDDAFAFRGGMRAGGFHGRAIGGRGYRGGAIGMRPGWRGHGTQWAGRRYGYRGYGYRGYGYRGYGYRGYPYGAGAAAAGAAALGAAAAGAYRCGYDAYGRWVCPPY